MNPRSNTYPTGTLPRYGGPIRQGDAFAYTARNAVFKIHAVPNATTEYFTVYYEATGEYRRYSEERIRRDCVPWTKPPKRKRPPAPPVTINSVDAGLPNELVVHEDGTIVCGCHRSKPGVFGRLSASVKNDRPKGFGFLKGRR